MTTESSEVTLARLCDASAGLLFPSESDFPFEPFRFDHTQPSPQSLLAALGCPSTTPVETLDLHQLFDPVIETSEGEEADRWKNLVEVLSNELQDVRVYRVGSVDIDVYIIGRHPSGEWIGLSTKVVET